MINKKIVITCFIIISILTTTIVVLNIVENSKGESTLKTAIRHKDIRGSKYILCKSVLVTGYDWIAIEDENGKMTPTYCKITGANPQGDLKLNYEFMTADNTYVFYITEKKEYYSEELKENCVEYVVSGWDILYPIKREPLSGFLLPRKYFTLKDTVSN